MSKFKSSLDPWAFLDSVKLFSVIYSLLFCPFGSDCTRLPVYQQPLKPVKVAESEHWMAGGDEVCLSKHYFKGSLCVQDMQQACASCHTRIISWGGKIKLWDIHEIHETDSGWICLRSFQQSRSSVFQLSEALFALQLPLTCFHSSDDIMVQQCRLGDDDTVIQICHGYFLWALSSHCADTPYLNKIRKRKRFLCFPVVEPPAHQCFILRHGPGCTLSSSVV